MERITIIGLGYIGASIGYTLRLNHSKRYEVVGFDFDSETQRKADKSGALDKSEWSLTDAVTGADTVVIATPASAARSIFEDISAHLKPGAVVTDTTNTAADITEWANELLPRTVGFISTYPLVSGRGIEEAGGATFEGARWAAAPSPKAPQEAVRKIIRLIEDLGAKTFFISSEEHDSYIAAASNLPVIVSNAMMLAAARSPSWREISKFATGQFGDVSSAAGVDPATNLGSLTANSEMTIHWIEQMILELNDFRIMLDDENRADPDGPLSETMNQAWDARLRWENNISPVDIQRTELPTSGDMMLGVFVGYGVAERLRGIRNQKFDKL
ncbi:MAG: prephenate dehydrogenase [Chloroflexi bacterium]|nr:prephenate dehydrogenase [Chloroflexota bacterium]